MSNHLALIVDDEPDIRELMMLTLGRMGIESFTAATLKEAYSLLQKHKFHICLTDMRLPDGNGLTLVEHLQLKAPEMPCAVITAHGNVESAVQALKYGAFDFVSKPIELPILRNLVKSALKLNNTPDKDRRSRDTLLGESDVMRTTRSMIAKLSRSQAPVYVSGESGTGKELVARLIHDKGPRSEGPFIPVNCGAIPGELMESEFFGHKKGSFTGAIADKPGLFLSADGGTLFLDEVADLPFHMQVKLLRAIQEKAVRPVGGDKELSTDVRILCATHKDLAKLVESGKFRQDLFYRLNVIELRVPPLRERQQDIPQLAEHIINKLAQQANITPPQLTEQAKHALYQYHFPGNVRELENTLERALTLCEGEEVILSDLQLPPPVERPSPTETTTTTNPPQQQTTAIAANDNIQLEEHLESIERELIQKALEKTRHNKTKAAELLGITFRALRYRLKKLDME
ncbi:MAG: sigma-54 dependent transcriptional regulator [Gammaproteobacteria bacterium]|nr:sigma-54 dependent transcriptional regulator [Gammaproteobacteria bacterium]MCF6230062.1 sigma-54 dependent transcriptional regulator [Gammaproteobacteria bacterium]